MLLLSVPVLVAACGDREGTGTAGLEPRRPGASGAGGTEVPCTETHEDRDGDGVPHLYGPACPGTLFLWKEDCDDDDPSVQEWRYPDADGDGDGAEAAACLASDATGYSASGSDCDDADPAVSSHTIEVAGDGIDQDCSGSDLEPCSDTNTNCPCSVNPRCALEPTDPCDGVDLAIGAIVGCFDGGEAIEDYIFIVNQGTDDFSGTFVLTRGTWESDVLAATVPAGGATVGIGRYLGGDPNEPVTISTPDAVDCNPDNDAYPGEDAVGSKCP
ncbi:MAG TPA: MopE-related protein [Polyangiaceae bacterium]|nr:MopE-related protein [Polyangiaceae bacterium]